MHERAVLDKSSFLSSNLFGNGSSYDVDIGCCYDNNAQAEVEMRNSYWGDATTAEMNDGDNPKNIDRIYDWWDDDRRAQVNYAQYVEEPINMDLGEDVTNFTYMAQRNGNAYYISDAGGDYLSGVALAEENVRTYCQYRLD